MNPWYVRHPFAAFQTAFWAVLQGLAFLPIFTLDARSRVQSMAWSLLWVAVGVGLTSAVGGLLERLPDASLSSRLLAWVLPGCVVGSAVWVGVLWALEPLVGGEPLLGPRPPPEGMHLLGFFRGAFLLMIWGGLALALLFSRRAQKDRERAVAARALADRAQLELLRSQLNPHFLFNALNSVVGLVVENPRGAQAMVRDISSLLRRALDSSRELATVAEELEFARLYLKVEQVRFEDRLHVTFEVDPTVEGRQVPSMVLQPLVENAVKHGLAAPGARLELTVRAARVEGKLRLEVVNSGTLSPAPAALPNPGSGLGLRSVRDRVAQLFPDGRFTLEETGGQVVARLELSEGAPR